MRIYEAQQSYIYAQLGRLLYRCRAFLIVDDVADETFQRHSIAMELTNAPTVTIILSNAKLANDV